MQTLQAALLGLRLMLAALALAVWLGPAAAASGGLPPPAAHAAEAPEHHAHREAAPDADHHRAGHDATACCAAACGPVIAPLPAGVAAPREPSALRLRAGIDRFPAGHEPAPIGPPPRYPSA